MNGNRRKANRKLDQSKTRGHAAFRQTGYQLDSVGPSRYGSLDIIDACCDYFQKH
jgi:hypothetical protein